MYHSENEKVAAGRSLLADHILGQRKVVRELRAALNSPSQYDAIAAADRLRVARVHLWSLRVIGAEFSGNKRTIPYPD